MVGALLYGRSNSGKAMSRNRYATPFPVLQAASLLNHRSRIQKFEAALKQVVTPESYVVDLGTGSGVLALLAAKAGARKVTAVDISQECID
jgi:predicted RNA methylase